MRTSSCNFFRYNFNHLPAARFVHLQGRSHLHKFLRDWLLLRETGNSVGIARDSIELPSQAQCHSRIFDLFLTQSSQTGRNAGKQISHLPSILLQEMNRIAYHCFS